MSKITTLTFFKFKKNLWKAFIEMGIYKKKYNKIDGLTFFKLLGTGGEPGFSLYPDFNTYAFLGVWTSKEKAHKFFETNSSYRLYKSFSSYQRTLYLKNIKSVGLWDKTNPFLDKNKLSTISNSKIGVITRATINWNRLLNFWGSVKPASNAISSASGVRFFKGIGELPFIQQATFSIWDDVQSIENFAYKNQDHLKIVKKTKNQNWYSEDLFARFIIVSDSAMHN